MTFSGVTAGPSTSVVSTTRPDMTAGDATAFGVSPTIESVIKLADDNNAQTSPRLIWGYTEEDDYTFLTADTTLYLSSSNNADTGTITVTGLVKGVSNDFNEITMTGVALTGQTQVALPTDIFRITAATQTFGTAIAGTVYIAELDGTISGGVPQDSPKVKAVLSQIAMPNSTFILEGGLSLGVISIPKILSDGTVVKGAAISFIDIHANDGFTFIVVINLPQFGITLPSLPFKFARTENGGAYPLDFSERPFTVPPGSDILYYASMDAVNKEINTITTVKYYV